MLDVDLELKKYKIIKENEYEIEEKGDLEICIDKFTRTFERISKEQYKSNTALEELLDTVEDFQGQEIQIKELKEKIKIENKETKNFIKALIDIVDTIDDMYEFLNISKNEELKESMELHKRKVNKMLNLCGIIIIGIEKEFYDNNLHLVKGIIYDESLREDIITKIIRKGYIYKTNVLRKAEVIVNKKGDAI